MASTQHLKGRLSKVENKEMQFVYRFFAMASPCEVHIQTTDRNDALSAGQIAETEALRIEQKYSRYRTDSVVTLINSSHGRPALLDEETVRLIDYAAQCHMLSDGLFDITSGVFRRIWRFDGSAGVPNPKSVELIKDYVGWSKVRWNPPEIMLPEGMELDFGGFGKEYAVDVSFQAIQRSVSDPILVNFGGDLRASTLSGEGEKWCVAIESFEKPNARDGLLEVVAGAIATSGDAIRCIVKDGVRYSHILDPRTGWPVRSPPRSVTVAASTCLEAGMLTTLAMLHGSEAENFLAKEGVQAWVAR